MGREESEKRETENLTHPLLSQLVFALAFMSGAKEVPMNAAPNEEPANSFAEKKASPQALSLTSSLHVSSIDTHLSFMRALVVRLDLLSVMTRLYLRQTLQEIAKMSTEKPERLRERAPSITFRLEKRKRVYFCIVF